MSPWPPSRSTTRPASIPASTSPAVDKLDLEIGDGEFLVLVGPSGCGKSTSPAHARRPRGRQRGRHPHRRPRRHRPAAQGPRHRDGVPELRALPAHDGRREHGLRAEDRRRATKAEISKRVAGGGQAARPRAVPRPQAEGPLRRSAPARGHGPGHRPPAAGVPDGRAAVQPRRQAPRADPHPDRRRCSAGSASPPSTSPTTRSRP